MTFAPFGIFARLLPLQAWQVLRPRLSAEWAWWGLGVIATLMVGQPAPAATDLSAICEMAAVQASKTSGVPLSVLKAISLTETGKKIDGAFRPWPWTVNMEGDGFWFDTEDEARAFVYDRFKQGAVSFDVGCFQINYKWHHEAFTSIDQMFEPLANALYAAEFLKSLYAEKGSWGKAAGAYHSRNAQFADRYQARFETLRAKFIAEDGLPLPDVPAAMLASASEGVDPARRAEVIRVNTYPLLQTGDAGLMGSLVPLSAASGRSLLTDFDDAQDVALAAESVVDQPTEIPIDAVPQPASEAQALLGALY